MYIYIYIYIYIYTHIYTFLSLSLSIYIYIHIYICIFLSLYIYIYISIYIYIFVHYILKLNLDIFVKLSSRLSRILKCLPRGKSQKHKWEFIKSKDNVLYCCLKHHNDMISTHFAHKEKAQRCSQVLEFAHSRD